MTFIQLKLTNNKLPNLLWIVHYTNLVRFAGIIHMLSHLQTYLKQLGTKKILDEKFVAINHDFHYDQ